LILPQANADEPLVYVSGALLVFEYDRNINDDNGDLNG